MNSRQTFWTAPAERGGDGAFGRTRVHLGLKACRACPSGVALRWPPQSKSDVVIRAITRLNTRPNGMETRQPQIKLT